MEDLGTLIPERGKEPYFVRQRRWLCVIVLLALVTGASGAASHSRPSKNKPEDPGYVYALSVANHFLNAWQTGDLETGMVLLSDHVRQSRDAAEVEQLFSSGINRAYEIGHGTGSGSRYSFPVALTTESGGKVHRKHSEIVVVKAGKNDWTVDKLP
jgi:hypothetical protein